MQWLSRLFGKQTEPNTPHAGNPTPAPAATLAPRSSLDIPETMTFSRRTPNPQRAAQGQERATYLADVAKIFAEIGAIDPAKTFKDLGMDELEVSECIQMAEEVWGVQLMPNALAMSELEESIRRFPTLNAIAAEAEAAARVATPGGGGPR